MEKLTESNEISGSIWLLQNGMKNEIITDEDDYYSYFKKLSDYENLEEQGLLLRFPCKVGDRLFVIWYDYESSHVIKNRRIVEVEVKEVSFGNYMEGKKVQIKAEPVSKRGCISKYYDHYFGHVIFHSREEAEEQLKKEEMEQLHG